MHDSAFAVVVQTVIVKHSILDMDLSENDIHATFIAKRRVTLISLSFL